MAAVQLRCEIDGCNMSWSVTSPAKMKASMAEHRKKFHPDWVQPEPRVDDGVPPRLLRTRPPVLGARKADPKLALS